MRNFKDFKIESLQRRLRQLMRIKNDMKNCMKINKR